MTGFLFAAQQASAAPYHLQRTLSVMTVVGRNRQVWVTPSPVTAETRGTDVTDCDRSLTSNCCNHLTPHAPPLPRLPRSLIATALGCIRARGCPATLKSSELTREHKWLR